jgi:FkbM family methyltransferase
MKALIDPSSVALRAYAGIAKTGILETKPARKLFLSAYYFYKKHFEDPFYSLARKHPHIFRGGHILDVGANVGYTAYVFSQVASNGSRVFAFEPEPHNVSLLLQAVAERQLENIILPVPAAVGREQGSLQLWVNKAHHGDHRIITDEFQKHVGETESRTVDMVSVDSFLSGNAPAQPVSFIKIDVQGYELEVCEGMKGTLARNDNVTVAFEYSPESMKELGFSPRKLLEFFLDRGFQLYLLDRKAELSLLSAERLTTQLQSRPYTDLLACRRDPRKAK